MKNQKMKFHVLGVRISDGEFSALQLCSREHDGTYSDYIRNLLREDAKKHGYITTHIAELQQQHEAAQTTIDALRAQVAALTEALEWYAKNEAFGRCARRALGRE
jgi:rubrerythrin